MQLNHIVEGQGEPLIILHGLFGMLDNWKSISRYLSPHFTVFLVDQRNHGRSPHTDRHDYESMAEDLYQFMDQQFVHKAHILGHSMGGKTAMEFALQYPDMVDKLVVVDIAPKAYPSGHDDIFKALLELDLTEAKTRSEIDTQLAKYIEETGVRQFLMKNISRDKEKGFQLKMNLPIIHRDYNSILSPISAEGSYEGESLFISGGLSRYIKAEDESLIKSLFPKAKVETIAQAGHWVHAEQPAALVQLLFDFLS